MPDIFLNKVQVCDTIVLVNKLLSLLAYWEVIVIMYAAVNINGPILQVCKVINLSSFSSSIGGGSVTRDTESRAEGRQSQLRRISSDSVFR